MNTFKTIAAVGVWLLPFASMAQWVPSAALNSMAPQHREWRIASQPDHGYWALSGNVSLQAQNSLVHPATWLSSSQGGVAVDLDAVYADLGGSNRLGTEAAVTWAQAGWFANDAKTFIDFAVTERIGLQTSLPEALLRLPFTGNASFAGAPEFVIDLSTFDLELMHHREWRMGIQHRLNDQLSVGLRLKRLHGFHHLDVAQSNWALLTHSTNWTWSLMGGGEVVSSGLRSIYEAETNGNLDSLTDSLPLRLFDRANRGWGVDAGAEYKWGSRLTSWVQYHHGGRIHWKEDIQSYSVAPFSWELDGFDASGWDAGVESPVDSLEAWANSELEALADYIAAEGNTNAYRASLPNKLILGSEFTLLKREGGTELGVGAVLERQTGLPMSWNVALHSRLVNVLETTFSVGRRFGLPWTAGASVAMPFGPLLFFASAEGHQMLDWTELEVVSSSGIDSWSMPTEAPYVAAQAGVVWRLGWRKPQAEPKVDPVIPFQNSTRSPALGFEMRMDQKQRREVPCALPGGN